MRSNFRPINKFFIIAVITAFAAFGIAAQNAPTADQAEKAQAVIAQAVKNLGGDRYRMSVRRSAVGNSASSRKTL